MLVGHGRYSDFGHALRYMAVCLPLESDDLLDISRPVQFVSDCAQFVHALFPHCNTKFTFVCM